MGVSLNNSVDAISVEMYPDVVHSSPFIVELFDLPVQFDRDGETVSTTFIDYMQKTADAKEVIKNAITEICGTRYGIGPYKKTEKKPPCPCRESIFIKKIRIFQYFFA